MKKILCTIVLAVFSFTSIFSLSGTAAGITDSDIEAFIENFDEIDQVLTYDLDLPDLDPYNPDFLSLIPESSQAPITKKLNELGISGSTALAKVLKIPFAASYIYLESIFDLITMFASTSEDINLDELYEEDSEIMQIIGIFDSLLADEDVDAIRPYQTELSELMGLEDPFGLDSYSDDSYWDDDYDYDYGWDDDYDYDYDDDWWDDDYDYDYDWDDYEWFTEEEELESEEGVTFLKELPTALSSTSGSSEFLYETFKAGNYTETNDDYFLFYKEWSGSKYPYFSVSENGMTISYIDEDSPLADEYGDVYEYYDFEDSLSILYEATIDGTTYYENVIQTQEFGIIHIWIDTSVTDDDGDYYAVLSIGDYLIEGVAL